MAHCGGLSHLPKEHAGLTADAFIHLPELQNPGDASGKIAAAPDAGDVCDVGAACAGRGMARRLAAVGRGDRGVAACGARRSQGAAATSGSIPYGSLMWDPGFHFAEVRLADVEGYQRRFTLKINLGRGSQRLSGADAFAGTARGLLPRAGVPHRRGLRPCRDRRSCGAARCCAAGYAPAVVPMIDAAGADRSRSPLSRTLRTQAMSANCRWRRPRALIASGKGILGTNREYLVQLATQLDALGIGDPYVAQLYAEIGAAPGM